MAKQKWIVLLIFTLVMTAAAVAQGAGAAVGSSVPATLSHDAERGKIDEVLKAYDAAYNHKSLEGLLAIYPSLQNDQKEFKKVKWHFEDPNVYSEEMNLQAEDVQVNGNQAKVRAKRHEKYYALEMRSEITNGDLNMQNMPAQDPGPNRVQRKHNTDKTETVYMTLQRNGENWQIASMSTKK
ncbi:MAG: hypothetical protein H0X25_05150 [Acidobacteriales bacterium]|nr:hypothetical protein [Terriglobales bacterium]